jgi:hypothetical protein
VRRLWARRGHDKRSSLEPLDSVKHKSVREVRFERACRVSMRFTLCRLMSRRQAGKGKKEEVEDE